MPDKGDRDEHLKNLFALVEAAYDERLIKHSKTRGPKGAEVTISFTFHDDVRLAKEQREVARKMIDLAGNVPI